jgi:hypothetical protein
MVVPVRQLPLDSSLQGIDLLGVFASDWLPKRPTRGWSCRTDSLFPNVHLGRFGEEAKLCARSAGRQPGGTEMTSEPFAKSNNFGAPVCLSKSGQG